MEARKFKDLPALLREVITDDVERMDMFQEKFLDYDDKDRWSAIRSAMDTCLERGLHQERAFYHVLFLQEIRGEEIDDGWQDMIEGECEDKEVYKMNCGTQTEPIGIQTDEPKQEVCIPMTTPSVPRGKMKKRYTSESGYKCSCCRMNLASDGSLHNHYKSNLHLKKVRKMMLGMRDAGMIGDKMIVRVRKEGDDDPGLSRDIQQQEDFEDWITEMEQHMSNKKGWDNCPIVDMFIRRSMKQVLSTGMERITWKVVPIDEALL